MLQGGRHLEVAAADGRPSAGVKEEGACTAGGTDTLQQCTSAKTQPANGMREEVHHSKAAQEGSTAAEDRGRGEGPRKGTPFDRNGGPSQETLAQLTAMGFTDLQARNALRATGNSLERAANWLLLGLRS